MWPEKEKGKMSFSPGNIFKFENHYCFNFCFFIIEVISGYILIIDHSNSGFE